MDTMYYQFHARHVKVSGGADLVTLVPTALPAPAPEGKRGEILDFDRCRRRLETKAAWKELTLAAQETPEGEGEPLLPAAPERRERTAGLLELCASAAVIAVSVAAILAFFRLV